MRSRSSWFQDKTLVPSGAKNDHHRSSSDQPFMICADQRLCCARLSPRSIGCFMEAAPLDGQAEWQLSTHCGRKCSGQEHGVFASDRFSASILRAAPCVAHERSPPPRAGRRAPGDRSARKSGPLPASLRRWRRRRWRWRWRSRARRRCLDYRTVRACLRRRWRRRRRRGWRWRWRWRW